MKVCHTREELARLPQGPKLVLATLPDLSAGMSRELFMQWAPNPSNTILFTQEAEVIINVKFSGVLYATLPHMLCTTFITFDSR